MASPVTGAGDPASRLSASRTGFAALAPRVAAGEPWALAGAFGTEPEASWGPREVLAHAAEMLPYWLGEYERVVDAARRAGAGAPFGRVAADALRIGVLERDRGPLPLRELLDRIDAGIARWERRLVSVTPADDARAGVHSRLGEMTAADLRDRFVIGHLEEHLRAARGDPRGIGRGGPDTPGGISASCYSGCRTTARTETTIAP